MLRVNLDETAVCIFQGGNRGTIFAANTRLRALVEAASTAQRRRYITHVGMICDRPELQPLLPQFLVCNEATITAAELVAIQAACPPNIRLVRQKSAWTNKALCARIVRALKAALEPHVGDTQVVSVMDAARTHIAALGACRAAGIWPLLVSARLTWLLQPLDTDGFSLFKNVLQLAYQRARSANPSGSLAMAVFVPCVCEAVRRVFQGRSWARAFDGDGYGGRQLRLSQRLKRELDLPAVLAIPSTRPSAEQIRLCFPARAKLPLALLWAPFDTPSVASGAGLPPAPVAGRGRGGARALARGRGAAGRADSALPGRGDSVKRTRSGAVYGGD